MNWVGKQRGCMGGVRVVKSRTLAHVLVWTSFYDQLAWSPIVAWLAVSFGAPEAAAWAATAYSAANLVGNLLFGLLSDRIDRLAVAGAGLLAMAVTGPAHLLATSSPGLIGVRALHGLAIAGVAPAAMASLTDGLPRGMRGAAMARVGLVIAVASMLATAASGRLLTSLGPTASVLSLACLVGAVGAATFVIRRRPDRPAVSMPGAQTTPGATDGPGEAGGQGEADGPGEAMSGQIDVAGLSAAAFVAYALMFLQNVLFYAYPLKGHSVGLPSATVGITLSAFGLGALLAFVPPLSRAADRWGRHRPMAAGLVLAGAGHLGIGASSTAAAFALCLFVYGIGFGLVFPAVSALNADSAGAGRRGVAFGLLTAAFSLGSISGPPVTQALGHLASPFAVAGALALAAGAVTALLYYLGVRPAQAGEPSDSLGRAN